MAKPSMWTTSLAYHDIHQEDINASHLRSPRTCEPRPPVHHREKTTKNKNFDRRLLSTILDSGTRPYMPVKRATSRVERAIMLLTALKPDRMGAERARLLNKEQRYLFVVTHSLTQRSVVRDQRSNFLRNTHHQLNGKNPSRYLRGSRPLKGTALRAGPRWLHPS